MKAWVTRCALAECRICQSDWCGHERTAGAGGRLWGMAVPLLWRCSVFCFRVVGKLAAPEIAAAE